MACLMFALGLFFLNLLFGGFGTQFYTCRFSRTQVFVILKTMFHYMKRVRK